MGIAAILESVDDLSDDVKGLYTERDGKFYLDVDGIETQPKVLNLKNAHETQKAWNAAFRDAAHGRRATQFELHVGEPAQRGGVPGQPESRLGGHEGLCGGLPGAAQDRLPRRL